MNVMLLIRRRCLNHWLIRSVFLLPCFTILFVISIFTIEDDFDDEDEVDGEEKEVVGSEFYHFNSDLLHWLLTEGSSSEAEVEAEGSSNQAVVVAEGSS